MFWLLGASLALADIPRRQLSCYPASDPASALIAAVSLPNGATVNNTYDGLARLTGTALADQFGHVLDGYVYGLDALGLRTNITRNLGLTTNTVAVGYDGICELTGWSGREAGGTLRHNEQLAYAYDAAGNLLANDGTRSFAYDAENQLTNVLVSNAWRVGFVYDGLNRRRISRYYAWQGGWVETNEVHYIYDGLLVLQERDTNNNPQVTYTRGLDLSLSRQGAGGIGGLLARTDTNGSTYYHADGNGNITAMMDGNQDIVARYRYDGFGKLLGKWGSLADANTYRYSSKDYDRNSGMYYYGFRFYEPNFQRWLNRDPIGENGGFNLYRFNHNRPIVEVDPLGFGPNIITDGSSSYSSSGSMYAAPDGFSQAGSLYNPGPFPPFHSPLDMLPDGPSLSDAQALANFIGQGDDPSVVNGIFGMLNYIAMAGLPEIGPAGEGAAAAKAANVAKNCPERPNLIHNSKHNPYSTSPEPKNVQQLFDKSIADDQGRRWAIDDDGTIHRFSAPSNGETHWNGSTGGDDPIQPNTIPNTIQKQLNQ
jgi:RHS repeat-associated protein